MKPLSKKAIVWILNVDKSEAKKTLYNAILLAAPSYDARQFIHRLIDEFEQACLNHKPQPEPELKLGE